MSHFATIKTKITNRDALVDALETMGYTVEVHDQPVEMKTRYTSIASNRGVKANIIIRRENIPYYDEAGIERVQKCYPRDQILIDRARTETINADVGFLLGEDGTYSFIGDDMYDATSRIQKEVKHQYTRAVITQQALALGHDYTVSSRKDEQGKFIGWTIEVQPDEIEYMGVDTTYNSPSLLSQF